MLLERGGDTNILALVLIVIIVGIAIVIAIVSLKIVYPELNLFASSYISHQVKLRYSKDVDSTMEYSELTSHSNFRAYDFMPMFSCLPTVAKIFKPRH